MKTIQATTTQGLTLYIDGDIIESDLYKDGDDDNFRCEGCKESEDCEKCEDNKLNYYSGDFFSDGDKVYIKGELVAQVVKIDNELFLSNYPNDLCSELELEYLNIIEDWYTKEGYDKGIKEGYYKELPCGNYTPPETTAAMKAAQLSMQYRGNSGEYFYAHILKV